VQHRQALEPLRRESQRAATAAARLAAEQQALDQKLAAPNGFSGAGVSLAEALKKRADLTRQIAEVEAQWLAAEEAIERAARG
jgi:hypothetical protein